MSLSLRRRKQISISIVYVVLCALVAAVVVAWILPDPSCSDGKKNGRETGVDCGGACAQCPEEVHAEDIVVMETAFAPSDKNDQYDVVARIENPNNLYGAAEVPYTFTVIDANGAEVGSRSGTTFVLPGQKRFVVELSVSTNGDAARAEFSLGSVNWQKFTAYDSPLIGVYNKRYEAVSGTGFSEVYALVRNESPFDFGTIAVSVVLRDARGTVIALNKTEQNTMRSGEERDFSLVWPKSFSGEVTEVTVDPTVNMFESDNFIRLYLPGGRFQEM